ncbi:hypothetical protein CFIMG_004612RAa [Ceratocystis fimbriata CBS 114723]|uniref:Uncharacterized protein n=1 Tax=Ceratocystis fimbriata CBS 114723 TaxID=1035309 RepID=A0A2C5X2X9_9PEZI|nr:hypothetical protein CFIMG_004612RAa [Ceratocystis fimbriata CBS 114723]
MARDLLQIFTEFTPSISCGDFRLAKQYDYYAVEHLAFLFPNDELSRYLGGRDGGTDEVPKPATAPVRKR